MHRWIPVLLLLISSPAFAWGSKGHRIIANVAERQLGPESNALKETLKILGVKHLADVAALPDEWATKDGAKHTAPWHFVNIPNVENKYDMARDCAVGSCAIGAMTYVFEIMGGGRSKADPIVQREALIFLIHVMGDLYQPFHCENGTLSNGTSDRNATLIHVTVNGKHVPGNWSGARKNDNLHFLWDVSLIEWRKLDEKAFVDHLFRDVLKDRNPGLLTLPSLAKFAEVSHTFAMEALENVSDHTDLKTDYMNAQADLMDDQLLIAGLKLADFLRDVFNSK